MKNLFALLTAAVVATLGLPGVAEATCMNQCKAELIDSQCTAQTSVIQGAPMWFWLECQTCCSPPGGPVKCDTLDPHGLTYKVLKGDGSTAGGSMTPSALGCPGKTGFPLGFIGEGGAPLEVGDYQLIQDSMILVEFSVVAKPVDVDAGSDTSADAAGDASDAVDGAGTPDGTGDAWYCEVSTPDPVPVDGTATDASELGKPDVSDSSAQEDSGDAAGSDLTTIDVASTSPMSSGSKDGCSARPSQRSSWPWALALFGLAGLTRVLRRRLR